MSIETQSTEDRIEDAQNWWNESRRDTYDEFNELIAHAEPNYRDNFEYHCTSLSLLHTHAPNPHAINEDKKPDEWYLSANPNRVEDPDLMVEVLENLTQLTIEYKMNSDGLADSYWFFFNQ